jgi:uncharacterized coiled-coil protein SlyX
MNKWLSIGIIAVLVITLGTTAVLYNGKSSDVNSANATITGQKTTIDGLNKDLTTSQAESADVQLQLKNAQDKIVLINSNITDFTAQNNKLTNDLAAAKTTLTDVKSTLAGAQSTLPVVQLSLSTTQSNILTLNATITKVTDPRHFASLQELKDWLAKDDTNIKYAALDFHQRDYILEVRALRDGFILSVAHYYDAQGYWEDVEAVIGGTVYFVDSLTDYAWVYTTVPVQPSHPEPLP